MRWFRRTEPYDGKCRYVCLRCSAEYADSDTAVVAAWGKGHRCASRLLDNQGQISAQDQAALRRWLAKEIRINGGRLSRGT